MPRASPSPAATPLVLPLDHVALGSRDLDAAQDRLAGLGLSHTPIARASWPTPDGPHQARTLSVVLPDGYLDVVELPARMPVLEATGVVLRAESLPSTRDRLMAAGIRCGRPYTIVRSFDGAGPDQRYEIFGIDAKHACGLPQSVIETAPAPPMQNRAPHSRPVGTLVDAARLLGVDLG